MKVWLLFTPFLAFFAAFGLGAVVLWRVARKTKVALADTQYGRALHMESPFGTLDMRPEATLDPRLAAIPMYPGAMQEEAISVESVTEINFRGKILREISAKYWTPDSAKQVWEFYRQQLPDWPRNLDGCQGGKELIHAESDGVRLIRISSGRDRTLIETCIKPVGYPHVMEGGFR